MGCCNSRPTVRYPSGGRQDPPTPTIRHEYIVRYRRNGQVVTETFVGGRAEELKADRIASLNRGTVRRVHTKIAPKEAAK
jgi:hypothetical protein